MLKLNSNQYLPFLLISILLFSCKLERKESQVNLGEPLVVCTTGMLSDAIYEIGKTKLEIVNLMGPGVDPHLYKATQGDLELLTRADIVVYNGLHLEGKMGEIFQKLEHSKTVINASEGVPKKMLINNTEFQGAQDPHIWFDISLWKEVVNHLAKQISDYDSSNSKFYKQNAAQYINRLDSLEYAVQNKMEELDPEERILITAHDAFGYFGKAYDFEVRGLQGISTVSEYGLKDIADLVNFICDKRIKAVFIESSVSERSLNAVVEGCRSKNHQLVIGGTLFSDSMGRKESPEGNYIGMFSYNVNSIVNSLKKNRP